MMVEVPAQQALLLPRRVAVVLGSFLVFTAVVMMLSNSTGPNTAPATSLLGGKGGIGPAWTYDSKVPKPLGTKNMGSYTDAVYTRSQQEELGVNEWGKPVSKNEARAQEPSKTTTELGFLSWVKGLLGGGKKSSSGGSGDNCQHCYSQNKKCCGVKSKFQCYTGSSSQCKHLN